MYEFLEGLGVVILFIIIYDWEGSIDFWHNGFGDGARGIDHYRGPGEFMKDTKNFGKVPKKVASLLDEVRKK